MKIKSLELINEGNVFEDYIEHLEEAMAHKEVIYFDENGYKIAKVNFMNYDNITNGRVVFEEEQ
jgi:uncharacterized protein YkuJ